jgi:DNA invertase Pin-like site-specific DNA recombinase
MVTFLDNPAMNLDTAHGELLLGILAATASFERRLILARTAEGRARAKVRGVKFGRPSVISDKVVKRITKLRAEGNVSASEIASEVGVSRRTVYRAIAEK